MVAVQTVYTRASQPVRVVSEGLVCSLVGERAKNSWIEQLTKVVQQLNQQLSQPRPRITRWFPQLYAMTRQSRLLMGMIGVRIDQWARLSPARLATVDVLIVAGSVISPEVVIRSVSRGLRT